MNNDPIKWLDLDTDDKGTRMCGAYLVAHMDLIKATLADANADEFIELEGIAQVQLDAMQTVINYLYVFCMEAVEAR